MVIEIDAQLGYTVKHTFQHDFHLADVSDWDNNTLHMYTSQGID